jgi:Uma2 family endonuclease
VSVARQFLPHYRVADYQQWDGSWELWQGSPVAMIPNPFGPHQRLVFKLAALLDLAIQSWSCDAVVLGEWDWIIGDDTVVRPDVMLICGGVPERQLKETPAVVAEVLSSSTRAHDLGYKRSLYRQQGVRHYLIVDPDAGTIIHDDSASPATTNEPYTNTHLTLSVCDDCELTVNLSELF